jgi:hypothetical protein
MRLIDDPATGLSFECDLPRTQAGNDTHELISTRRISGASIGFQTFADSFERVGASVVRHLESIRLAHISPTAQPAYPSTHVAVRSLAHQLGEDINDVVQLANAGELRSLFGPRTDQLVSAAPTVLPSAPTPLEVAQRSYVEPQDDALKLRMRLNAERGAGYAKDGQPSVEQLILEHYRRKSNWDAPAPRTPGERLLELHRRKSAWDSDTEARTAGVVEHDGRGTWR